MTTPRARPGLEPDPEDDKLPDFQPRARPPAESLLPAKRSAELSGFTTRHARPPEPVLDGRSFNPTSRTAQLNIAVTPETRARFWSLAREAGVRAGEEFLLLLLDALEDHERRRRP